MGFSDVFYFFSQGEHLCSVFLFIQTVQLGSIQGERVEDSQDSFNRIQSSASERLSYQKLPNLPLFPLLLVVHQINFCVAHSKLSHIAKINQDISICNECFLECIRELHLHLTIQALQSESPSPLASCAPRLGSRFCLLSVGIINSLLNAVLVVQVCNVHSFLLNS